jgi:hypothetical protein
MWKVLRDSDTVMFQETQGSRWTLLHCRTPSPTDASDAWVRWAFVRKKMKNRLDCECLEGRTGPSHLSLRTSLVPGTWLVPRRGLS